MSGRHVPGNRASPSVPNSRLGYQGPADACVCSALMPLSIRQTVKLRLRTGAFMYIINVLLMLKVLHRIMVGVV